MLLSAIGIDFSLPEVDAGQETNEVETAMPASVCLSPTMFHPTAAAQSAQLKFDHATAKQTQLVAAANRPGIIAPPTPVCIPCSR